MLPPQQCAPNRGEFVITNGTVERHSHVAVAGPAPQIKVFYISTTILLRGSPMSLSTVPCRWACSSDQGLLYIYMYLYIYTCCSRINVHRKEASSFLRIVPLEGIPMPLGLLLDEGRFFHSYHEEVAMSVGPGQDQCIFFSFFLSWVANIQLNHWTKRVVSTQVITSHSNKQSLAVADLVFGWPAIKKFVYIYITSNPRNCLGPLPT